MVGGVPPPTPTGVTEGSPGSQTPGPGGTVSDEVPPRLSLVATEFPTERGGPLRQAVQEQMVGSDDPVLSVASYAYDGDGLKRRELVD